MIVRARCKLCRAQLPEFSTTKIPDEILCSCGITTTGKEIVEKIKEKIKESQKKVI